MAKCAIAAFHSRNGRVQRTVILRRASQSSLLAASSLGKWPRVLMILRSRACTLSKAFVVYRIRRTAGGKAKKGMTCDQARRHKLTTAGKRAPHGPAAKASSAAAAASAVGAG